MHRTLIPTPDQIGEGRLRKAVENTRHCAFAAARIADESGNTEAHLRLMNAITVLDDTHTAVTGDGTPAHPVDPAGALREALCGFTEELASALLHPDPEAIRRVSHIVNRMSEVVG